MIDIGKSLRSARARKRETLRQVADNSGVSTYFIHSVENNKYIKPPNPDNVKKLEAYYGISGIQNKVGSSFVSASSSVAERLSSRSYGGRSTLYEALGYPPEISYEEYRQRYKRQDIANRIVNAPVNATWKDEPTVSETTARDTLFEKEFTDLAKKTDMYFNFKKTDLLACLGRYAVLFIGLKDTESLSSPPAAGSTVNYFSPIPENRSAIEAWDINPRSSRFGLPSSYSIQFDAGGSSSSTRSVHWTRVVHVAENTLESEVFGIPYLEPVYNRLIGLDKLAGGSPEMYWRGARPGYTANAQQDSIVTKKHLEETRRELTSFAEDLQRVLYVEGIDIKPLAPQVVSPKDHVDVQLMLISAATGIPTRMLTGSERGELASSQDERSWLKLIEQRRLSIARDLIIDPMIERLIFIGALPSPKDGCSVTWGPLVVLEEKDKAEIGRIRSDALSKYLSTPGAEYLVPPEMFMKRDLGFTDEEMSLATNTVDNQLKEERE